MNPRLACSISGGFSSKPDIVIDKEIDYGRAIVLRAELSTLNKYALHSFCSVALSSSECEKVCRLTTD